METVSVTIAVVFVVFILGMIAFVVKSGRNFVSHPKWTGGMLQAIEDYGSRIKQMPEQYRFKAVRAVALGMVQEWDDGQYVESWAGQQDVPYEEIIRMGRDEATRGAKLFQWYAEQQDLSRSESPDHLSEDHAIRYAFFRHAMVALFEVVDGTES